MSGRMESGPLAQLRPTHTAPPSSSSRQMSSNGVPSSLSPDGVGDKVTTAGRPGSQMHKGESAVIWNQRAN